MQSETMPLVVAGDVMGDFEKAFEKLKKVNARMAGKNNEVPIIIAGDFFGDLPSSINKYIEGEKKVPFHFYVLGPISQKQDEFLKKVGGIQQTGFQHSITNLGKYGVLQLAEGLTLAYVGGMEGKESNDWTFTAKDIDNLDLMCRKKKIDVIITYQWPYGIEQSLPTFNQGPITASSKIISELILKLRPRIHFAANVKIPFQSPFMIYKDEGFKKEVTTFIGLTELKNYKNGKWVYAMDFPLKPEERSNVTTIVPYYSISQNEEKSSRGGNGRNKRPREHQDRHKRRAFGTLDINKCWFCLGNPDVEKDLLLVIGQHSYLTLAKGPIVDPHILIVTIDHIDRLSVGSIELLDEADKFITNLSKYFKSRGKKAVWFESCLRNPHTQVECIGIDAHHVHELENNLKALAEEKKLDLLPNNFTKVNDLIKLRESSNYFHMQLGTDKGYSIINLSANSDFPLNFARNILVKTMGVMDRLNWRQCLRSDNELTDVVDAFKQRWGTLQRQNHG